MFDVLLTDDPSNWPWHSFINLPLIPLALIFSRLPLKSNVTPLVPLLLAWPTSAPVSGEALNRLGVAAGTTATLPTGALSGRDLFPLLPHWPPPPFILGLFIFPIVREGYKRMFTQLAKWILGSTTGTVNGGGGEQWHGQRGERDVQRVLMGAAGPEDEPFLRIRVNAHVDEDDGPVRGDGVVRDVGGVGGGGQPEDGEGGAGDAAVAAENTIRVSGTSLGRLIGGALIVPRISSLMGSLLLLLSKRSAVLRRILAVRPSLMQGRSVGGMGPFGLTTTRAGTGIGLGSVLFPRAVFGAGADRSVGEGMGLLKKLGVAGMLGLSVAWRGTYAWAECDPVWCVAASLVCRA